MPRRPVNFRSLLVGLFGVAAICTITPFNDFVVGNTYFTGNFLPVGMVLLLLLFLLLVNAPLSRFFPARAFTAGELAVIFGMMLVSCTLPSSGLMRFLPAQLVGIWHHSGHAPEYQSLMRNLDLPDWMFPDMETTDPADRANEKVIRDFYGRAAVDQEDFPTRFNAVPWSAWARPALMWGALFAAIYGAVICLVALLRRQWVENERLQFPLATLYVSLIEPPEPGRFFNRLFASRGFWIAFAAVFIIHFINGMHQYSPEIWPQIPLRYNFHDLFVDPPWSHVIWFVKASSIFFIIVGITYFVQSKIAFSIWFCMLAWQIPMVVYGTVGAEFSWAGTRDQLFGGMSVYALAMAYVGRREWALVARQMFRGARPDEPRGRYLSYPVAGWGLVICLGAVILWLVAAGATIAGALVIVMMFLLVSIMLMRVVAETGLPFIHFLFPFWRPWQYLANQFPAVTGGEGRPLLQPLFHTAFFDTLLGSAQRESPAVYTFHALRVADQQAYDQPAARRRTAAFILALILALAAGFIISGISTLYVNYSYSATLDGRTVPINSWAINDAVRNQTFFESAHYNRTGEFPPTSHSHRGHFTFGATLTTLLTVLHLRYPAWPIHPLGYLLLFSWTIWLTWFSILLGWLAKVLIIRFGGGQMFRSAMPFFIGMIMGEVMAVAFWLIVNLARVYMGLEYQAINLLPI